MDNDLAVFFGLVVALVFAIGIIVGSWIGANEIRYEAIERNVALFCPTTGKFAWNGECETNEK